MEMHAEIWYDDVHSDICPPECNLDKLDTEHRGLLHACLDEWLDKSNGKGGFVVYGPNVRITEEGE